jgi:hypothetical protein
MRIYVLAISTIFTILSFAEATPACMRPISPLYVDIYGFGNAQMEYIRESGTRVVTVKSDNTVKEYHYNSNFTLDQILEKNKIGKKISAETFTYSSKNQLISHRQTIYKGTEHVYSFTMKKMDINSLVIAEDTFAYNEHGDIKYAYRIGNVDYESDAEGGWSWYPRFEYYPYRMTIKLQSQSKDSLIYSCNIDNTDEKYGHCPTLFYIIGDNFLGYENHLCKSVIRLKQDTSFYQLQNLSGEKIHFDLWFLWGTYIKYDSSLKTEKLFGYTDFFNSRLETPLIEKQFNKTGALISRIDNDFWGRSDTTIYIRNETNNRIESITIHFKTTDYSNYINYEPENRVTERSETIRFSYK